MDVIAFLLFAVIATKGVSPRPQAADEHADIYSIYSLIMTNPSTSHGPSTDEVYLIADMTRPAVPAEPCVRVPPQHDAAYQEILDEYHRRKDKPVKLERALNIAKPYELMDADDFGFGARSNALKSRDLFRLGDVYFNKSHTLALTAISTYCGPLCGQWLWKVFEYLPRRLSYRAASKAQYSSIAAVNATLRPHRRFITATSSTSICSNPSWKASASNACFRMKMWAG
jgi:hypothetical protein